MPRYFFDIVTDTGIVRDDTGVEAADNDEVLDQAWGVISELTADNDIPEVDNVWTLIIRDEAGAVVGKLPLS